MLELSEVLYIFGFILIMSGVIKSSNSAGIAVSQDTSFFSISNIGKMATIALFINALFVFSWWLPLITFIVAVPLGPLIYYIFDKLKIPYASKIQIIFGIVISVISLNK